ncbi:hypothetical protein [Amycolatopsis sp. NPDC059021]|uniref:hypothetical protein n=1 Tax=Amycolatopsis sp. NPDC059021 TaxID=3346704 RepID=UPI003672C21A
MSTPPVPAASDGEVYVELADTTAAFPAIIDDQRWNGYAVPRFRRIVADAIVAWLNTMHDHDPANWADTATFDGDVLTVLETEEQWPVQVVPDEHGRYGIGAAGWCWELTAPPTDERADAALLADTGRLAAEDDEILVTINIDGTDPAFPALTSAEHDWSRAGSPRFRRPVAEVVVAWIADTARKYPEGTDRVYWEGDTIVLLDHQAIGEDGYLPARITADEDGRYAIGATFEWERAD